jgi:CheY-like chemotaxis protein
MGTEVPEEDTSPTALVVERDPVLNRALCRILERSGYAVVPASSAEEGLTFVQRHTFSRIYAVPALWVPAQQSADASAGPHVRVEARQDGTARIQIDQTLPWDKAVELLDKLSDPD